MLETGDSLLHGRDQGSGSAAMWWGPCGTIGKWPSIENEVKFGIFLENKLHLQDVSGEKAAHRTGVNYARRGGETRISGRAPETWAGVGAVVAPEEGTGCSQKLPFHSTCALCKVTIFRHVPIYSILPCAAL